MTRRLWPLMGLLLVGMLLAGCTSEPAVNGVTRTTPLHVGDVALRDVTEPAVRAGGVIEAGELTFAAADGRFLAVYFGFLNCPDICPTTLMDLRVALERVDASMADRVDVVFVTVDPQRDTPSALGGLSAVLFPPFSRVT